RVVGSSQKRVEGNNFDARKRLLEYDDVQRRQREIIYRERNDIIENEDVRDQLMGMIESSVERTVEFYNIDDAEHIDYDQFINTINDLYFREGTVTAEEIQHRESEEIFEILMEKVNQEI